MRLWAVMAFLTLFIGQCQSQFRTPLVEITEADTVGYNFINQEANIIENAIVLQPLYTKLLTQRTEGGKKVSIVHIGDSHILGNLLTLEVRKRLQREFGDAGRGLIFPYKLAQSNGQKGYMVETNCRWSGSNCQRDLSPETSFGISGFKVETTNVKGEMTFKMRDSITSETQLFTKVTVFQRKNALEYELDVRDDLSNQKAQLFIEDDYSRSFYFDRPVGQVTIAAKKTNEKQRTLTIDGICLENELSGVLYHSIGVNGAKFMDYARAKYFARQVSDLEPDLVILSFGTNEGQGKLHAEYLKQTMNALIDPIRERCPGAAIMLTTPADSYLRGKGFNPYLKEMSEIIREYAMENDFALWDLHAFSGGENSAIRWKANGLMSSDSVHYSKAGYAVQGKLLYQSIIKAYNGFVEGKR
jgi:lysophospholipase L1-like esterase